jgi:hypothetical protein
MPKAAPALATNPEDIQPTSQPDGYAGDRPESRVNSAYPTREDIAREAYLIYMANGQRDGHAEDDWFAAERELMGREPRRHSDATQEQAAAQLDDADAIVRTPG